MNRQSKKDGREETGTESNDSKALNKEPTSGTRPNSLFA